MRSSPKKEIYPNIPSPNFNTEKNGENLHKMHELRIHHQRKIKKINLSSNFLWFHEQHVSHLSTSLIVSMYLGTRNNKTRMIFVFYPSNSTRKVYLVCLDQVCYAVGLPKVFLSLAVAVALCRPVGQAVSRKRWEAKENLDCVHGSYKR